MLVLGIESSCDETGIALYDSAAGLLSHALHSQVAMHAEYGGVVPELASRDHIRRVVPLLREALGRAGKVLADVDAVAYTRGPGLAGALLVGCAFAEALALALDKPTIPVHHLEGHLLSPLLSRDPPTFPFIALLVSGGHTQLMKVTGEGTGHRHGGRRPGVTGWMVETDPFDGERLILPEERHGDASDIGESRALPSHMQAGARMEGCKVTNSTEMPAGQCERGSRCVHTAPPRGAEYISADAA